MFGTLLCVRIDESKISFFQLTVFVLFQMIVNLAQDYLVGCLGYVRWILSK